jgi:hypothetical protein
MDITRKPRHIRDIAHLYISRPHYRSMAQPAALWIAAEDRGCLPGFHVANLAAALCARDWAVEVVERSGLLPNAGFYMALPPSQYIAWEAGGDGSVSGIGRMSVAAELRGAGEPGAPGLTVKPRIELTHLPPLGAGEAFRECLLQLSARPAPLRLFLVLSSNDSFDARSALSRHGVAVAGTGVLHLGATFRPLEAEEPGTFDLGSVGAWRHAVADRVPQVMRAPDSLLSRTYCSISDSLLSRIRELGKVADADSASDETRRNRPGERHRGSDGQGTVLQVPRRHLRFSR